MDDNSQVPQQPSIQPINQPTTPSVPAQQPVTSGVPVPSSPTVNAGIASPVLNPSQPTPPKSPSVQKVEQIIYLLLGFVEIVLVIRMALVLLGANAESGFVSLILRITSPFSAPFKGVFGVAAEEGLIEPSVIIAMIVYALVAYGLSKLARVLLTKAG